MGSRCPFVLAMALALVTVGLMPAGVGLGQVDEPLVPTTGRQIALSAAAAGPHAQLARAVLAGDGPDALLNAAVADQLARMRNAAPEALVGPARIPWLGPSAPPAALPGAPLEEAIAALYALDNAEPPAVWATALARWEAGPAERRALANVFEATAALARATLDARSPVEMADALGPATARLSNAVSALAGAPPLEVDDCDRGIIIHVGDVDDTHTCPAVLLVDTGGNDVYLNNAGGLGGDVPVNGPGRPDIPEATVAPPLEPQPRFMFVIANDPRPLRNTVAVLVDGAGDDRYVPTREWGGLNGGSVRGSALLVDLAGDDEYNATFTSEDPRPFPVAANGAASGFAAGALVDLGGDDTYGARSSDPGAANGAGVGYGMGLLFDARGDDETWASLGGGAIGGAGIVAGRGLLVDLDGTNEHRAVLSGPGVALGAADGGVGLLLDAGEDSTFTARGLGVTASVGAARGIAAVEVDAVQDATEDVALGLFGQLGCEDPVQVGGEDDFVCSRPTFLLGLAAGGECVVREAIAPEEPCEGLLPGECDPLGGTNCALDTPRTGARGYAPSLGVLIGGAGDDHYEGRGVTQGAGDLYGIGLLVDPGGDNTYVAHAAPLVGGVAQGAGRDLGVGLLWDGRGTTSFELDDDVVGQGAGLGGTGALVRVAGGQPTSYDHGPGLDGLRLAGGGLGLQLNDGPVLPVPVPTCGDDEPILDKDLTEADLRVLFCPRNETKDRPIHDPTTDEPLTFGPPGTDPDEGRIWKPALSCDATPDPATCETLIGDALGPNATRWLEQESIGAELEGGILYLERRPTTTDRDGDLVIHHYEADETCWPGCHHTDQQLELLGDAS